MVALPVFQTGDSGFNSRLGYVKLNTGRWFIVHKGARPYNTPASTAEWKKIPPRRVRVYDLHTTQEYITLKGLWHVLRGKPSYSGDKYPHLVLKGTTLWIVDGHHRAVLTQLSRNGFYMEARVYMDNTS